MKSQITGERVNWHIKATFILLGAILIMLHVRLYQYSYDDAYIHFRIVRNLLDKGVPYFNASEAVKVSTSSGWTVVLAIVLKVIRIIKFDSHFPLAVSIMNAIFTLGGMTVYTKILEILQGDRLTLFQKLLFQISFVALLLPSSIGLMETPLALLMAGWGICLILQSRLSGFALLGFAAYIRIELLILLVLAVSVSAFARTKFDYIRIASYVGIGTIPLLLYDLYFFSTVIPHSMVAKSAVFTISWSDTVKYVLFYSIPAFVKSFNWILISGILFIWLFASAIFPIFHVHKRQNTHWQLLFSIWGILTIVGYALGHALIFQWYIPMYTIPLFIACFMNFSSTKYKTDYIYWVPIFTLFFISVLFITKSVYASMEDPSAFTNFISGSRVRTYLRVGNILYEEYPNESLMTTEIGGLGYSFSGEILDAAGLASPDVLAYHPMKIPEQRASGGIGAIPPDYVREKMPGLIVSYDYFTQALLSDDVSQRYNMILIPAYLPEDAKYSNTKAIAGDTYLRIYIRKDLPVSEKILALEK